MKRKFFKAIVLSLISYILGLSYVFYLDYKYEEELNKFDLNKDGFFQKNEINKEQEKAMALVVNDTARNLSPYTLVPISLLIGSVVFLLNSRKHDQTN